MPPKLALNLTPMATRARNKDQHPGAYYIPKPRRTAEEMDVVRKEEANKKRAEQERLEQGLKNVATIEDSLRNEDMTREVDRAAKPRSQAAVGSKLRQTKDTAKSITRNEMKKMTTMNEGRGRVEPGKDKVRVVTEVRQQSVVNHAIDSEEAQSMDNLKPHRGTRRRVQSPTEEKDNMLDLGIDIDGFASQPDDNGNDSDTGWRESGPESEDEEENDLAKHNIDKEEQVEPPVSVNLKKKKPGRADIIAMRHTEPASGTPEVNINVNKRKISSDSEGFDQVAVVKDVKKKFKPTNRGLLPSPNWEKTKREPSCTSSLASTPTAVAPDDDTTVRYGGLVGDHETDEVERKAIAVSAASVTKPGTKRTFNTMIKIENNHQHSALPMTQKDARGGDKKWQLKHLPAGTADIFTKDVVPRAREKAGTLNPWNTLSVRQIQDLVDEVYGNGQYVVTEDNVWFGLVGYRLNNWRNTFGTIAVDTVQKLFNDYPDIFDNAEAIAEFVASSLEEVIHGGLKTSAFHWKDWNNGQRKKGFLQNEMILATFANAHLAHIGEIDHRSDEKPVGALILSMQAVGRALSFYSTGSHVQDRSPAGRFSADNYGDKVERTEIPGNRGKFKQSRDNRATQYVATVKAFKEDRWRDIFEVAQEFMVEKRNSRASISSRASSEDIVMEDIILASDD